MSAREKKHTPTPWKFSPWHIEEGPSAVRAPAGHIVCTTASDADAELIVRAVNAHDDLVKALEKAKEIIRIWHGPDAWEIYDSHSPEMKPINAALALSRSAT